MPMQGRYFIFFLVYQTLGEKIMLLFKFYTILCTYFAYYCKNVTCKKLIAFSLSLSLSLSLSFQTHKENTENIPANI
jgi:hypothetical protein